MRLRDGVIHFVTGSTAAEAVVDELIRFPDAKRKTVDDVLALILPDLERRGHTATVLADEAAATGRVVALAVE